MRAIRFSKLPKDSVMEIEIKFTRRFRFRMWMGVKLISLAAIVMGCGINIVKAPTSSPS